MKKRLLASITASATAVSLAFSPCITAFAQDISHIDASNGDIIEHQGDISADDGIAPVIAKDENTVVTIEGDISSSGERTRPEIFDPFYTEIAAASAIEASDGAQVNIFGNITTDNGGSTAEAFGNGTQVNINGDIYTLGQGELLSADDSVYSVGNGTAFFILDGAAVSLNGDMHIVDGGDGILAVDGSNISCVGNIDISGVSTFIDHESVIKAGGKAVLLDTGSKATIVGDITVDSGGLAVCIYEQGTSAVIYGDVNVIGSATNTSSDGTINCGHGYVVCAYDGANAEINGNIYVDGGNYGACSYGTGSTVTVNGNVESLGVSKIIDKNGNAISRGSRGVVASKGSLKLNGNVVSDGWALSASAGSNVSVDGDVIGRGIISTVQYTADSDLHLFENIENDVYGVGIDTDCLSDISVNGNVYGYSSGILLKAQGKESSNIIVVTGDVISSKEAIHLRDSKNTYSDTKEVLNSAPILVVGGLSAPEYAHVDVSVEDQDKDAINAEIKEALLESINYIINVDDAQVKNYGIAVSGENVKEYAGYNTVNVDKAFQVAAMIPQGYMLDGGNNVKVTQNSDGTYTLVLINNNGGINIRAILIPVDEPDDDNSGSVESGGQSGEIPAGAIVITSVTASAPGNAPSINGNKPARSLSFDLGNISASQYQAAVIQNIAYAPANGALNIETDRVSFFDSKMIEALAARSDIDVNVAFIHGGRKINVTIPAGYNVRQLLDSNGYCGFLRLLDILGNSNIS